MKKYFIVEDELIITISYSGILTSLGLSSCGQSSNAQDALTQLGNETPDLIIMDIHLNSTLTGLDVAKKVRKSSEIPIIFTTGNSPLEIKNLTDEISNSKVLIKPVREEDLIKAVLDYKEFQDLKVKA